MAKIDHSIHAFLRDETGSMTVEFAIWAPLLAMLFLLSVTGYDAYKSRNDAAKAAYAVTDLLAAPTGNQLSTADLSDFRDLITKLLPRAGTNVDMRVSSIQFEEGADPGDPEDDIHTVLWSDAQGDLPLLQSATIPLGLMPTMAHLDTVLLVELSIPYQTLFTWVGIDVAEWNFQLVTRPRFGTQIAKVD